MVTCSGLVSEAGAVYNPVLEILPTLGLMDQFEEPAVTPGAEFKENCWLCAEVIVTDPGVIQTLGISVTKAVAD